MIDRASIANVDAATVFIGGQRFRFVSEAERAAFVTAKRNATKAALANRGAA